MSDHRKYPCEYVESRWRIFGKEMPNRGQVFVGRNGKEIYPNLFVMHGRWLGERGRITHLDCHGTVIGYPHEFFTHWLPVAEMDMPDNEDT
jgi:hypothetical protein